jgi:hypothetical protein
MKPNAKNRFRLLLFMAQGGCCAICGEPMSFNRKKNGSPARDFATFEHVDRREDGGHLTADNTCLTHYKCNIRRNAEHQKQKPRRSGALASGEVLDGDSKLEPLTKFDGRPLGAAQAPKDLAFGLRRPQ